jgi:hypothetical protein
MKSLTQFHIKALLALFVIAALFIFGVPHAATGSYVMIGLGIMAPFPVTPQLQAIALAYRNDSMIADAVLPRKPVGLQSFKFLAYPKGQLMTVTETRVSRKGTPNQVEFTATEMTDSTNDEALDDMVPIADIELAAKQGLPDPLGQAVEGLTDLIALKREVRTAALVFGAGNYAASNKTALAGIHQWSDYTAGNSDPINDIVTGLDSCIYRPNVMVLGQAVSSKLRRHPAILKSFNGTSGDTGMVPLQYLADLFELEEVLVGQGWVNTAKKGQSATLSRVWGKSCALIYRDKLANPQRSSPTFGFTAQFGPRIAGQQYDGDVGMRGGQKVRVGESVKELLMANDLGYFIDTVIA